MTIRPKAIVLLAAALLVASVTGCANPVESVVKEAIKNQTGVDINSDGDGFTIETEEGKVSVETGGEVPSDFPSDVPLPNGKLTGTTVAENTWSLMYEGIDRAEVDRIIAELESQGFTRISITSLDTAVQGAFEKDKTAVSVIWSSDGTSGTLIYGAVLS